MSDETAGNPEIEETKVKIEAPSTHVAEGGHKTTSPLWWLISLPSLLIILTLGFAIYLSGTGIDIAWAVGTSGWIAPPGTKLAGYDIGGKSFDDILPTLEQIDAEFSGISVWLVENPDCLIRTDNAFTLSTAAWEVALSVTPSDLGIILDQDFIRTEIAGLEQATADYMAIRHRLQLWQEPPSIELKLKFDENAVREFLFSVKSTVDCEPINAVLDLPNHAVTPSRDGIVLHADTTLTGMPEKIGSVDDLVIVLDIDRVEPEITSETFDNFDLDNPLAVYTTNFNKWKRNRSFNIELVAAQFEGVVIQSGETFSFNDATGPRGLSQGYRLAPMYLNSRPELSPAGGACQVSTTIYNAFLLAGFEIIERYPHSRPCSYVPYGRDATVAYDSSVDLVVKSTLEHPVIIHQVVDRLNQGTITFELFGHPDDRVHVEIGNAYSWIGRGEPTYVIDTSLAPGEEVVEDEGVSGISQRAWRVWFDENGNELYTEDLSSDRIRPVGAYIRHNPVEGAAYYDGSSVPDATAPANPPSENPSPETPPPGTF